MADIGAGIDINRGHRFSLIDDQITTGFERNFLTQRPLDFLLNPVQLKNRSLTRIVL